MQGRRAVLPALYSAIAYLLFLAVFLYAIGFVENLAVPKDIDSGEGGGLAQALAIDTVLLTLFAVQHSGMARRGFKRYCARWLAEAVERSTYVLSASLALILLFWQWRPIPQAVWSLDQPLFAGALRVLSWSGWALVLASTFLISHFHLFGLSQGFAAFLRRKVPAQQFTTPLFYRWLRHPIYAGFILAFWGTPRMSVGHLVFAAATTAYILLGIWLEERDLIAQFGERYRRYRDEVGMLLPRIRLPLARPRRAPGPG